MGVVDAGVDDRDLDVLALEFGPSLPDRRGADVRHAHGIVDGVRHDRDDADDAGQAGEAGHFAALDVDLDAVQRVGIVREDPAAAARDRAFDAGVLLQDLRLDRGVRGGGDRVVDDRGARFGDRGRAHHDDDLDVLLREQRQRLAGGGRQLRVRERLEAARSVLLRQRRRGRGGDRDDQRCDESFANRRRHGRRPTVGDRLRIGTHVAGPLDRLCNIERAAAAQLPSADTHTRERIPASTKSRRAQPAPAILRRLSRCPAVRPGSDSVPRARAR